ncbi:MAG: excinuclease ABC subunit UvrB [Candidatus Spechtbacteria bacterium]|nr:excinuclease ABC subunit UvrB [Candidatus Spechtbacteria bacterium]
MKFKLVSPFSPTGDQPQAIKQLSEGVLTGKKHQVLLGVTGSGKTFTVASVIEKVQKPTLVMSPNKTLAWQLYQEFKEFFPDNAVEYFVSYYDYYQPEAYIPQSDTYIEKDARVNEKIDQMRHQSVQSLLTRNDVIVIASVSCIYNLGSPKEYQAVSVRIAQGQNISRQQFLHELVRLGYTRNDIAPGPGNFSAKGAQVKVHPSTGLNVVQIEFDKNTVSKIAMVDDTKMLKLSFNELVEAKLQHLVDTVSIFPAHFWITPEEKLRIAIVNIKQELQTALANLRAQGKLLEAQRLESRTNYDIELIEQTGWCHGIENYSSHLEFRPEGSSPYTLLDYLAESQKDFLTIIDESHLAVPQVGGMYFGDKARKTTLVDYGFRLPSAKDNRPLKFSEFEDRIGQRVYVSATPGHYEYDEIKIQDEEQSLLGRTDPPNASLVEQVIRPTGLVDPSIEIRPTENQMRDAIAEIEKRIAKGQRSLVVTITKRLAEDIAEYLAEENITAAYLHSEIHTLERPKILRDLRLGVYDVLVGINLLREGLDLPETSLVVIFDADKEGFLRNETTLVQTMGRAARHLEGHVIMYADQVTGSMKRAISEVDRRRKIQIAYNEEHNITPRGVEKKIYDMPDGLNQEEENEEDYSPVQKLDAGAQKEIEKQMKIAAKNLDFEKAAKLRDKLNRTAL